MKTAKRPNPHDRMEENGKRGGNPLATSPNGIGNATGRKYSMKSNV